MTKKFFFEEETLVVYKRAFEAKRRGRSVHIRFLSKVISQKKTQTQKIKKLYYINGGTQEKKFDFIKIIFHLRINGGTQERKRSFVKIFLSSLINGGTQERKFNFVKKHVHMIPHLR